MSKGEARRSQSAISFNFEQVTKSFQDQTKEQERKQDTPPTLLVNQASTSTITEEPITVNVNYLSCRANNNKQNTDKLALKLNQLKDKSARYVSHKEFLTRCIENILIPKGFELLLEPTIGNYDQGLLAIGKQI